jgi:hypothetical protein
MQRGMMTAITLAVAALGSACPPAEGSFDVTFRGMIVCEKLQASPNMLRSPLDITVAGTTAIAARPNFMRTGTVVVGSEIATGSVGDDGRIKLISSWKAGWSSYWGSYGGTLSTKSGMLTGTQAWTLPAGRQSRTCTAAVVQTKS